MLAELAPLRRRVPTPVVPPRSAEISLMRQDPSVVGAQMDTVCLELSAPANFPATKDFELASKVLPNANGNYVFPQNDVANSLPMSVLANLQQSYDIFTSYCENIPPTWNNGNQRMPIFADYGTGVQATFRFGGLGEGESGFYFFHHSDDSARRGATSLSEPAESKAQTWYTGMSGEIVRHEGGHAILDRFRPAYHLSGGFEADAFAESFGDVVAMLTSLCDPKTVDHIVDQIGPAGDLHQHNIVADFGEQFGINLKPNGPPWLRTAIHKHAYQSPEQLPEKGSDDQLFREVHSFSQVWTGATYDLLAAMVSSKQAEGLTLKQAINDSTDQMLKLYGKLISKTAPKGDFRFPDMAQSLLQADASLGGQWAPTIEKVMTDRNLLKTGESK